MKVVVLLGLSLLKITLKHSYIVVLHFIFCAILCKYKLDH